MNGFCTEAGLPQLHWQASDVTKVTCEAICAGYTVHLFSQTTLEGGVVLVKQALFEVE